MPMPMTRRSAPAAREQAAAAQEVAVHLTQTKFAAAATKVRAAIALGARPEGAIGQNERVIKAWQAFAEAKPLKDRLDEYKRVRVSFPEDADARDVDARSARRYRT